MKVRYWLSLATLVLIMVIVIFAWKDIKQAFALMATVNVWILLLMIPVQIFSFLATGEVIFSYLRSKGSMKQLGVARITRIALEFNFVNHIFPSSGASGIAYLGWLLKHHGVSVARSTMAQLVRIAVMFISYALLLLVSLGVLIIDHGVNRVVVLFSLLLVVAAVGVTLGAIYLISSKRRLDGFVEWVMRVINGLVRRITRGRRRHAVHEDVLRDFLTELHDDYLKIRREWSLIIKPFLWVIVVNIFDALLVFIAFWALGHPINLALVVVGYGLATSLAMVATTPGGTGVYEAIMVAFFAAAGVSFDVAIAGTLLARVLLLIGTIVFGYVFYQLTIIKYGKTPIQGK